MVLEPLRLCHLRKRPGFEGYGFSLNAEKGIEGQFIGSIDSGSPAEAAGLKTGDRLIEVNGVDVLQDSHAQVVARIKAIDFETKFLVISENEYLNCTKQNIPIKKESYSIVKLYSEPEEKFEYLAKVCHLKTWKDFDGYGFSLHYNKESKKHLIGKIDDESPARVTGLVEGDVLIEVNGVNVELNAHKDVVDKILEKPGHVSLLLLGPQEEEYFNKEGIRVGSWMSQLKHLNCPDEKPDETTQQECDQHPSQEAINEAIETIDMSLSKYFLRRCHLKIFTNGNGYGFNMQSEKGKEGQYISNIDFSSPAETGGLREGDMIVGVNGAPIKNKTHQEVVVLIKENPNEVVLHVVDAESREHFEKENMSVYDLEEMHKYTHECVTPSNFSSGGNSNTGIKSSVDVNLTNGVEKKEVLLDVNSIPSSDLYKNAKAPEITTSGSGGVQISTEHVPSPTTAVGGVEFAASAQEARQRLAKKKQASQNMSLQARYEIYNKL